eukprot:g16473.t1
MRQIREDGARALSSYDGLKKYLGEKKAEQVVKQTVQIAGHLPAGFAQSSSSLPDCIVKPRGGHVRKPLCDPEEKGVLLLKPGEVLDLSVLLGKMHIEGAPVVPGGEFTLAHLAGEAPDQELVTVAQASAGSGEARRAAVEKLDKLVDTSKADGQKESLAQRYLDAAESLCGVTGCFSSLYEFLAVSLDSYKTTAAAVRQVMKTDWCVMTEEEKEDMEAVLRRLKTRGHIGREDQRAPLTLVDIFEVHVGGLLSDSELTILMLCFYCGFRPSEVKKLAVDYQGETDVGIKVRWDRGDLIVNFVEASTKVNKYKSVRVKCMCKKLEQMNVHKRYCICALQGKMDQFSARQDAYEISKRDVMNELAHNIRQDERVERNAWSNIQGLTGESHPEFSDFQKAVKVIKNKEVWTMGKRWRLEPSKPGIHPVHFFATAQTACQGALVDPLLTLPQRDDCIAKFWSAQNNLSVEDAASCWGECLMDTQSLNPDVVGTTYEGRIGRWVQNDLPGLWRSNYRAQERVKAEKQALRKEAEEQRAKDAAANAATLAAAAAVWQKGRGGKRREPYGKGGKGAGGKKGKTQVCHPFLAGNCTWGGNCKFLHPTTRAQFSEDEFNVVCTEFPDKMRGIKYGQWLPLTTPAKEKDLEKKDD